MNTPTAPHPEPLRIPGPDGPLAQTRWSAPGRPVVVLIHGYPDNRGKWDAIARLLWPHFEVVAYDVRGAGESFVPASTRGYRLERLTADFTAVIDAVSPRRPVHLVAHDWGSVQSWEFVTEPALRGRIASFTSCSGPCLDHVGHWIRSRLRRPTPRGIAQVLGQTFKSWYIWFFQLPWLPEALWRAALGRHWPALMRRIEGTTVEPRATQTADGVHGIGLYRANVLGRFGGPRERHAHAPVQLLVLRRDRYVSPALFDDLARWVPRLQRHEIDAGHWMTLKHPERFAAYVRAFVDAIEAEHPTTAAAPAPAPAP